MNIIRAQAANGYFVIDGSTAGNDLMALTIQASLVILVSFFMLAEHFALPGLTVSAPQTGSHRGFP